MPTNWLEPSRARGWTKLPRPIAQANRIAWRCPAAASRRNFLLRLWNKQGRKMGTATRRPSQATSIFSGRTSVACRQTTPKAILPSPRKFLFAPLKIADAQIHRIRGEDSPEAAAKAASTEISQIAPVNETGQPVLDLIFLGMGEDGHVASLFPGEPDVLISDKAIYRAVKNSPKPPPNRVTLGYAAIAAAKQVWVLVSGTGKEAALRESLFSKGRTPLARVTQFRTRTKIFSDFSLI